MRLAQDRDGLAAVDAAEEACVRGEFADAVEGTRVETGGAVGLGLQPDAHVFDGAGDEAVGEAGEGARGVVLGIGEFGVEGVFGGVLGFEVAAGVVEAGELDGDLGGLTQGIRVRGESLVKGLVEKASRRGL